MIPFFGGTHEHTDFGINLALATHFTVEGEEILFHFDPPIFIEGVSTDQPMRVTRLPRLALLDADGGPVEVGLEEVLAAYGVRLVNKIDLSTERQEDGTLRVAPTARGR
jgi:hypothetical protein